MSSIALKNIFESLQSTYGAEAFRSAVALMALPEALPKAAEALPKAAAALPKAAEALPEALPKAAEALPKKARGPKKLADMTPEERAAWEVKKAERSAAKAEKAEGGEHVKRKGRTWTAEQKEEASAKRKATIAAKKAAALPEPIDFASGVPEGWSDLTEPKPVKKYLPKAKPSVPKVDLSLYPYEISSVSYLKNDRGDLLTEEGEWVGRLIDGKIDESVGEPTDLDGVEMRE